jgi:hypothetical protein
MYSLRRGAVDIAANLGTEDSGSNPIPSGCMVFRDNIHSNAVVFTRLTWYECIVCVLKRRNIAVGPKRFKKYIKKIFLTPTVYDVMTSERSGRRSHTRSNWVTMVDVNTESSYDHFRHRSPLKAWHWSEVWKVAKVRRIYSCDSQFHDGGWNYKSHKECLLTQA